MHRAWLRTLLCTTLLLVATAPPVLAHAALETASPGPDEVVTGTPGRLIARFTQDLQADRTRIELRDPGGTTIATGGKDPDRDRVQVIDLPVLAPGTYEVRWVTWSAEDDEIERGRYTFTVSEPTVTPGATPGFTLDTLASLVAAFAPIIWVIELLLGLRR